MFQRTINFGAGPGVLPLEVLQTVQKEMLNYKNNGLSILEISHRSQEFECILNNLKTNLCSQMNIPANYSILFLQGGATLQFAMITTLFKNTNKPCDYVISGVWSQKALEEGKKLGLKTNVVVNLDASNPDSINLWKWSSDPAFVYFCDNETVNGVEFPQNYISNYASNIPLICDASSNFLSREMDVSKYAIIFAGAQKNLGPAGLTAVIIRNDLLKSTENTPTMLDYSIMAKNNSTYNTPPVFSIYVSDLMVEWIIKTFGNLKNVEKFHEDLARRVYKIIEESEGFYLNCIHNKFKSKMNIVFRICSNSVPNVQLEKEFVDFCYKKNMTQLEGHRSVGGIRVSIYNAMTESNINCLVGAMNEFKDANK